jgi:uncharacterized membrane protein
MDWVFAILLFLHVMGAIIAFGPPFAFIILGPMSGREPMHANFAVRFQHLVATRLILPLAVFQGITGLLIVWRAGINLFGTLWLLVAITLYVIALANAFLVILPTATKLVEATSAPPPAPPPGAEPPKGPPPHIAALVRRARMAGMLNAVLILAIVFLMVTKPF